MRLLDSTLNGIDPPSLTYLNCPVVVDNTTQQIISA